MWTATKASESSVLAEQHHASENIMKKKSERKRTTDELRPEYDFSKLEGGVRGKYLARYRKGTNLVLLSPDVAKFFPDEESVNRALRMLIRTTKRSR